VAETKPKPFELIAFVKWSFNYEIRLLQSNPMNEDKILNEMK